ncbi:protein CREG1-like [Phalaenopsis equestris]|uniref:protein CREG1-like n=1 Tax=Phalaenopsis equestris TaxID=78828 RepID=UPI0009E52A9A|nr:protein CREG1-like [Phalaenopsis equestris]XP_020598471.1 protein CREG1-like [Phalaenopsis equestris]
MKARTMKKISSSALFIQAAGLNLFFLLSILLSSLTVRAQIVIDPPVLAPVKARYLVARSTWGVLSTISADLGGAPFGTVVSFSDGEPKHGFGVPYFYLAELEPIGRDEINGTRAALTVSEASRGTCGGDIQSPGCKRTTLTGKLTWISLEDPEVKFAQVALFTKHPEMESWPSDQNFKIYKLDLEDIFLVDKFGKPTHPTLKDYLKIPPI